MVHIIVEFFSFFFHKFLLFPHQLSCPFAGISLFGQTYYCSLLIIHKKSDDCTLIWRSFSQYEIVGAHQTPNFHSFAQHHTWSKPSRFKIRKFFSNTKLMCFIFRRGSNTKCLSSVGKNYITISVNILNSYKNFLVLALIARANFFNAN